MASGTRQNNTMSEGLRKLLGDIADLKLSDDVDLPFLINLETQILQQLKGGADQALGQGGQGGQGGMPAGLMGSPAPPPGMGSPPGTPGLQMGPMMPNADELRRTLRAANVAHRLPQVASQVAGM